MNSRCEKTGQTEIGIIVHEGREFAALGSSVTGNYVSAYTKQVNGRLILTSWCGKTMLDCRSEIVETYHHEWHSPVAIVFSLTGGRYIVGYALDDSGSLFRGELTTCDDADEAAKEARSISEHWYEIDTEDNERFQEELRAEDDEDSEAV